MKHHFFTAFGKRVSRFTSGARLRHIRERRGISPERLASVYAGGVPVSRIIEIEQLPAVEKQVRKNFHMALDHANRSANS